MSRIICVLMVLISSSANAEYNSIRLGEAAGAYISSVDVFRAINESSCAQQINDMPNVDSAIRMVMISLNEDDKSNFVEFIRNQLSGALMKKNNAFVKWFISDLNKSGKSMEFICGSLIATASSVHLLTKNQWINAADIYGLHQ